MEKPGPDASPTEQMEYLEDGFWESFTLGVKEASEGEEDEEENEIDGIEESNQDGSKR